MRSLEVIKICGFSLLFHMVSGFTLLRSHFYHRFMSQGNRKNAVADLRVAQDEPFLVDSGPQKPFSWTQQWYPVGVSSFMDTSKPQLIHILNKRLVLWKSNHKWTAADEACPHRLASLSVGYINASSGTLSCRYHGMEFSPDNGACIQVPTTIDPNVSACSIVTYPAIAAHGLVWVWPDDGPERFIESAQHPLPFPTEELSRTPSWFLNEWPIDWLTMIENNMDPSHASFTHSSPENNLFDRKNAVPMTYFKHLALSPKQSLNDSHILEKLNAFVSTDDLQKVNLEPDGFVVTHSGYQRQNAHTNSTRTFLFPCTSVVRYAPYIRRGSKVMFLFYFVPTRPGRCLVIGTTAFSLAKGASFLPHQWRSLWGKIGNALHSIMMLPIPGWLQTLKTAHVHHKLSGAFQMQDIAVMYPSTVSRYGEGKAFHLQPISDFGVRMVHTWLEKFSPRGVPWFHRSNNNYNSNTSNSNNHGNKSNLKSSSYYARRTPRLLIDQLTDRWEAHSKFCVHCSNALLVSDAITFYGQRLAVLSICAAVVTAALSQFLATKFAVLFGLILIYFANQAKRQASSIKTATPALRGQHRSMPVKYRDLKYVTDL